MDTTQPSVAISELLAELEQADPADAPATADRIAALLGAVLDDDEVDD